MEPVGMVVAVAVLVLATAFGLWRRRTAGRLRPEETAGSVAVAAGRSSDPAPDGGRRVDPELLASLGAPVGQVTLLQFSSAFCAPCRATRQVCAAVAGVLPGVRHVEIDAESHLAAVRALNVWRTPTVLVLDQYGTVIRRATGVPTMAQVAAAVGGVLTRD